MRSGCSWARRSSPASWSAAQPDLPGRSRRRGSAGTPGGSCRSWCSRSSSRGQPASRSTASSPRDRPGSTSRTRSTRSASAARSSRSRRSSSSRAAIGLGTVVGRVLPTLIAALILGYFGVIGVQHLHADFTAREAVIVAEADLRPGDRYIDQFFKLPDGRIVGYEELAQIDPASMTSETGPTYPIVYEVIPAERYREVEAREALILGSIGVAMLVGAGLIVTRRRPG